MRKLRKLSIALVVTLMLSAPAFAGTIGTSPEPPPEPPSATATGIIGTVPIAESVAAPNNPIVDLALNLLQSALSLF